MQIDFYILAQADERWHYTCRLLEKAWRAGERVFVYCESSEHAQYLDRLLWTFRDNSFVPHVLAASSDRHSPIAIASQAPIGEHAKILLNLHAQVPPFIDAFERVLEVVDQDPAVLAASRSRFRHYRSAGHELITHRIDTH